MLISKNKSALLGVLLSFIALLGLIFLGKKLNINQLNQFIFNDTLASGYLYILDKKEPKLEIIDSASRLTLSIEKLEIIPDFWAFKDGIFYYGKENKKALFLLNLKEKNSHKIILDFSPKNITLGEEKIYLFNAQNSQEIQLSNLTKGELKRHEKALFGIYEILGEKIEIAENFHNFKVEKIAFSPNKKALLLANQQQIAVFEIEKQNLEIIDFKKALQPYADNQGKNYYFISENGQIFQWQKNLKNLNEKISAFSLGFLDKYLIVFAKNIHIFETLGLKEVIVLDIKNAEIKDIFLSADSKFLYFNYVNNICVLNIQNKILQTIQTETQNIKAIFMGSSYTICH